MSRHDTSKKPVMAFLLAGRHAGMLGERFSPAFDLLAVRADIEKAREEALALGAEVCHVEEADGVLKLVAVKESKLRLPDDTD